MGTAGPGIFDDDTACDVRDEYEELLHDQVDDRKATRQVLDRFLPDVDDDERHLVWLALAAAQSRCGRLEPVVRDQALALIDAEAGLQAWQDADPGAVAGRRAALQRLRIRLTGPQPPRKTFRRRWRYRTDLHTGDLLVHTRHGWVSLWLVGAVTDTGCETHPVVQRLAWPSAHVPTPAEIDAVASRGRFPVPLAGVDPVELLRRGPRDPDWSDVGFTRLAAGVIRGPDPRALSGPAWMTGWSGLAEALRDPGPFTGPRPEPAEQIGFRLTTWDPLGIGGTALIEAEYDPLVTHLIAHLTPRTTAAEIAALLRDELLDRFGLSVTGNDVDGVAQDLAAAAATWTRPRN